MSVYTRLDNGELVPAIPEPFWIKSWRTLFRWKPGCYQCRMVFKDRADFETHYMFTHQNDVQ